MKKSTIVFLSVFLFVFIICTSISLFTKLPLFDAVLTSGSSINQEIEQAISLKFLFDKNLFINSNSEPMSIKLTTVGWFLVFIFNIGMPLMFAWSISLKINKKK